jgi:hypothetical protein
MCSMMLRTPNQHVGDAPVQLCRDAAVWIGHAVALAALVLPYGRNSADSINQIRALRGLVEEADRIACSRAQDIQPIV